jgi:hypothetical protein
MIYYHAEDSHLFSQSLYEESQSDIQDVVSFNGTEIFIMGDFNNLIGTLQSKVVNICDKNEWGKR